MATNVTEDWERMSYSVTVEGREALRVFQVELTEPADPPCKAPYLAVMAPEIPRLGQAHPADVWLGVVSVIPTSRGPRLYEVTVRYQTGNMIRREYPDDPLSEEPEIAWDFATSHEMMYTDANDTLLCNSAGDMIDPPIVGEFNDLILRVVRNEASFNPVTAYQYKGSVNSDLFYGIAAGQCRLTTFSGQQMVTPSLTYWKVTYEVQFRFDGWKLLVPDMGLRAKRYNTTTQTYEVINIPDPATGNPIVSPWYLNGNGFVGSVGDPVVTLEFNLYRSMPFGPLGLQY